MRAAVVPAIGKKWQVQEIPKPSPGSAPAGLTPMYLCPV